MKEFMFQESVELQPTALPKTSSFKVFFQGFFLLFYFNTFEWLLPNFCLTRLLETVNLEKNSKLKIFVIF